MFTHLDYIEHVKFCGWSSSVHWTVSQMSHYPPKTLPDLY